MRKPLMILSLVLSLPAWTPAWAPAWAEEGCFVPLSDWQPRAAVVKLAESKGWAVRRIKIDDGCYEIDGKDQAGQRFEATVNPATLEVLKIEHEAPEAGADEED